MFVLTDGEVEQDPQALEVAWRGPDTFAFVAKKSGVSSDWMRAALEKIPTALRTDHFALLTSGSTGAPKLVVGEKRRADRLARTLHEAQESEPARCTILALPLTYCYAFVNQWLWSRTMGRQLIPTLGFSQPDMLSQSLLAAEDSMLCLVGAQVPLLLQSFEGKVFTKVRRLHFAGGRFPQDRIAVLSKYFPAAQIYNNYGCAEAMPRLTLRRAEASPVGANIGRPLPTIQLRSSDADELQFISPYGSVGYVDSERFHGVTEGEWTATGDLAKQQEDGTWELLGRSNEVFKRYGEKISLLALQTELEPCCQGQLAFYREVDSSGEIGHVLVVAPDLTGAEMREMLRTLRAKYSRTYWPLRIESVRALPRLPNGKIDTLSLSQHSERDVHWRQHL